MFEIRYTTPNESQFEREVRNGSENSPFPTQGLQSPGCVTLFMVRFYILFAYLLSYPRILSTYISYPLIMILSNCLVQLSRPRVLSNCLVQVSCPRVLSTYLVQLSYPRILSNCFIQLFYPTVLFTCLIHVSCPTVLSTCLVHVSYPPVFSTYLIHVSYPRILSTYLVHVSFSRILSCPIFQGHYHGSRPFKLQIMHPCRVRSLS